MASTAVDTSWKPVITITCGGSASAWSSRNTSMPSRFGIFMSRTTTS